MIQGAEPPRGRGTAENPPARFEPIHIEADPDLEDPDHDPSAARDPRTRVLLDRSRSILSHNQSPDVPFETSLNPYRGCEHGCAYCYARPTHEYLGLSAGLDFETQLIAKPAAPDLLRRELSRKSWRPRVLALSGVTDPYQPIERQLRLTRGCLEVMLEYGQPVGVITKGALVARDVDLLARLANQRAASVTLSLTTLDPELARRMEPRAAQPRARLRALRALRTGGVPAGVNLAPIIPGLNDHEIPALLEASAAAGAQWASMLIVRLPGAVSPLFDAWLERNYPDRRSRVLSLLRSMRNGSLNDARFGARMRGSGPFYEQLRAMFDLSRRRFGIDTPPPPLTTEGFRPPPRGQLSLL